MLSGILLFHFAKALVLENTCAENAHWGIVLTPDCETTPKPEDLHQSNQMADNPRGVYTITTEPLADIGR